MRRTFNLCVGLAVLLGAGCGPSSSPAKTYQLGNHTVEVSPPPAGWREDAQKGALFFHTPSTKGHVAVTVSDGVKLDQATVDRLALPIRKRGGSITNQKSTDMCGEKDNATRMEYSFDEGGTQTRGAQMHFTCKGNLYSIVLTVPSDEFSQDMPVFEQTVNSFKLK